MIVIDGGYEYCEIEDQKVNKKVDFPKELGKNRQELHRKKVVSLKGNEKIIAVDDDLDVLDQVTHDVTLAQQL